MLKGIGQKGIAAGVGVMLLTAVGCTVDVYSPPPQGTVYVESAPPPPPPPEGEVIVTDEPPPEVEEVPPPPPDIGFVWITGDVVFVNGHWERHPGHYERPPAGRVRWVGAHYRHTDHGYIRVEGHWQ